MDNPYDEIKCPLFFLFKIQVFLESKAKVQLQRFSVYRLALREWNNNHNLSFPTAHEGMEALEAMYYFIPLFTNHPVSCQTVINKTWNIRDISIHRIGRAYSVFMEKRQDQQGLPPSFEIGCPIYSYGVFYYTVAFPKK